MASSAQSTTYFRWSRDKPCTTNAVYGWLLRGDVINTSTANQKKEHGQEQTTRTRSSKLDATSTGRTNNVCEICLLPSSINKFNINEGYVMGRVPVSEKTARRSGTPHTGKVTRSKLATGSTVPRQETSDVCLWHTLSGALVHLTAE
jgi:hypothetical protein